MRCRNEVSSWQFIPTQQYSFTVLFLDQKKCFFPLYIICFHVKASWPSLQNKKVTQLKCFQGRVSTKMSHYIDTVGNSFFRLSLEDLVDLERKRRCGMSRHEILSNVYCPVTPPSPTKPFHEKDQPLSIINSASAICVEGSRSGLPWSNNATKAASTYRSREEKKAHVLASVLKREVKAARSASSVYKTEGKSVCGPQQAIFVSILAFILANLKVCIPSRGK